MFSPCLPQVFPLDLSRRALAQLALTSNFSMRREASYLASLGIGHDSRNPQIGWRSWRWLEKLEIYGWLVVGPPL